MADIDYGKASREDFKKKNPGKENEKVDEAYLNGEEQSDSKGLTADELKKLRRKIAEKAGRYLRPVHGYTEGNKGPAPPTDKPSTHDPAKEEILAGGIYRKDGTTLTDAERCTAVYKWVEDVFWPKSPYPRAGSDDADLHENWAKLKILESTAIDVGKRLDPARRSGWYCIEHACFLGEEIDPEKRPGYETPFHDLHVYVWDKSHYNGWDKDKDGGLTIFGGLSNRSVTKEAQDEFMKGKEWTRGNVYTEAGAGFKNIQPELRMGLQFGDAICGYASVEQFVDSLTGAVYQPFGRLLAPMMADPRAVPAEDEFIAYNLYEEGEYPLQLLVTNRSELPVKFVIEANAGGSPYLDVTMKQKAFRGIVRPGQTRSYDVPLQVRTIAHRPPAPVRDLKAYPQRDGTTVLHWSPIAGATKYKVYVHDQPLIAPEDFAPRRVIGRSSAPCFRIPKKEGTAFYA